jgi:hypothetical protein
VTVQRLAAKYLKVIELLAVEYRASLAQDERHATPTGRER